MHKKYALVKSNWQNGFVMWLAFKIQDNLSALCQHKCGDASRQQRHKGTWSILHIETVYLQFVLVTSYPIVTYFKVMLLMFLTKENRKQPKYWGMM